MPTEAQKANFSQGWGVAAFITALAVGAFVLAGVIKSNTYHSPNDPLGAAPPAERAAPAH